jgi:paraquat-inducible protein B
MAKQVSKTVIGGFVISAIALLVVGIVIFGGGKFFTETEKFVLFFDRSVKGLDVGSSVVFRGVKIGSVDRVMLYFDAQKLKVDIPVVIQIEPNRFQVTGTGELPENQYDRAKVLIDHGIKAQLATESLVTGQLMIEVDFHPDVPVRLTGFDAGYPELPTMPSPFEQLTHKLRQVPIEEIFDKLLSAINSINKVLSTPELMDIVRNLKAATDNADKLVLNADNQVKSLLKNIQAAVHDARKLLKGVNNEVKPLSNKLQAAAGDISDLMNNVDDEIKPLSTKAQNALVSARDALDKANQTLATYDSLMGERSELRNDLTAALEEIALAARSLRKLTDYLERHPEALLQGKGSGGGN